MRRFILIAGCAVLFRSAPARAWECPHKPAAELESPQRAKAPLNAHLRVRFTMMPTAADLAEITLRRVGGKAVPFRARALPEHAPEKPVAGYHPSVLMELVPLQKLRADSHYELAWKMSERALAVWRNPWRGNVLSVGKFTTSSSVDDKPPTLPAQLATAFVDRGYVWHTYKNDDPGYVPPTRLRAWPQGLVDVAGVSDDQTPSDELYYLAWRVGEEKTAFLLGRREFYSHVFEIGDGEPPYECQTSYQFPFPKKERRFSMAVVAIDLAGNVSAPRYFLLDRSHIKRKVPKSFQ